MFLKSKMFFLGILICTANIVTANFFNFLDVKVPFHRKITEEESSNRNVQNNYSVCRTQECFKLASEFWESMNKSVDPCEDFYEFACGGWSVSNPVPPTEMSWSTFHVVRNELNLRIRDLLEEPVHEDDFLPVKQVKKFYSSCMDMDALEKAGIKPIETILSRNGGWPMAMDPQEWNPDEFTWQQIDAFYTRLIFTPAFYSLMNADGTKNFNNFKKNLDDSEDSSDDSEDSLDDSEDSLVDSKKNENLLDSVIIVRPKLSPVVQMPRKAKFNRTRMYEDGSYAKLISQVATIFAEERGVIIDKKQINTDVEDLIKLESKLYQEKFSRRSDYIMGSINKVQKIYDSVNHHSDASKINWKKTINNIFDEANIELNGTEMIIVPEAKYLKQLSDILDTTNVRTIVNYVHWNFISRMIEFTNTKMETLLFELNKKQVGVKEMKPRWERCIENVDLKHAVSYQFVKNFFTNQMEDDARKIFQSIQNEMIKHIIKSDWLDDKSRKMELQKIKAMKTKIGYPKWYNNETELLNHYRGIVIGQQFMDNKISYIRFSFNRNLRTNERILFSKKDYWRTHPIVVNAYYNPIMNSLTVPAADFLAPFYSPNRPETVNYGFLGAIVGHEVSHGFDDTGIFFDENGKSAHWPINTRVIVTKKMSCFINQYSKFYNDSSMNIVNLKIKSMMTLGENIADSLGLQMMFGAFKEKEMQKSYPRLPGFVELNGEQSFFLSFAKLWCINTTPEYEKLKQIDSHSEGRYRLISTVQNSDGFAKAFKCPANSPMNPEKKCTIW